jgi:Zn-dependent protease with chaperone function
MSVRWYLVGLLPILWISIAIYSLVFEGEAGTQATQLMGLQVTRGQMLAFRLKATVLSLPALLLIESLVVVFALGLPAWLLLIGMPVLAALALLAIGQRYRILYPSRPLEETQWARLAPRISDWAKLARFPYRQTRVTSSQAFGFRDGTVGGLFRRTLYLSDGVLSNTDWRQQDALIVYLFARDRRIRLAAIFNLGTSVVMIAAVVGLFLAQTMISSSAMAELLVGLGLFLLVILLMVLRLVVIVRLSSGNNRVPFYCDRVAAELTGDPLAMTVLLNTLNQITGGYMGAANPYFNREPGQSLLLQRMAQLDSLMRQPGPRAPWAYQLVPSMGPVYLGPAPLTIPYEQPGTTPPPVPATRYPVSAPAAPMFSPAPPSPAVPITTMMPADSADRPGGDYPTVK